MLKGAVLFILIKSRYSPRFKRRVISCNVLGVEKLGNKHFIYSDVKYNIKMQKNRCVMFYWNTRISRQLNSDYLWLFKTRAFVVPQTGPLNWTYVVSFIVQTFQKMATALQNIWAVSVCSIRTWPSAITQYSRLESRHNTKL